MNQGKSTFLSNKIYTLILKQREREREINLFRGIHEKLVRGKKGEE
jgi:hypothetical protein